MVLKYQVLFLLIFFIIWCRAQFRQDTYHIIHDTLTITKYNHSSTRNPQSSVEKFINNSVSQSFSGSAYFTPGVKKSCVLKVQVFRFVANAYRRFPINVTLDICQEAIGDPFGVQSAYAHSNWHGCPCAPGDYYIKDYALEENKFPPHIPLGKYKLIVDAYVDETIYMLTVEWFGQIIPKPKNNK